MLNTLLNLSLLFAISYAGYKILDVLRFPASRLIGPILSVAIAQLLGLSFGTPSILKNTFAVIFGIFLGLRFNREALAQIKAVFKPALILSLTYIFITLGYGLLLERISTLDATTSFLAVIPGGIAESGILAASYHANLSQVSAFQLVRFLAIVVIMPLLSMYLIRPIIRRNSGIASGGTNEPVKEKNRPLPKEQPIERLPYFILFISGTVGGLLFNAIHFPAAYMLGATAFVAATQNLSSRSFSQPPIFFYNLSQLGMGAVIGASFTRENTIAVTELIFPLFMMTLLILTSSIFLGFLFSKLFRMDYMTGLLSVLPGGLSTMILLAEDFESDVVTITALQLTRLLTAVAVIPLLYQLLL